MREQAIQIITDAAYAAGLPEGRVIRLVKKDNITLERPRIEIQFLPETYKRTGRKLGITRTKTDTRRKRELYEVTLQVLANVLAESESWLETFAYNFVARLPKGFNDKNENWVKVRVQKATFGRPPDVRVADDVIEVFKKANELFAITFTWRITMEEVETLIPTFSINPLFREAGEKDGDKKKE